MATTATTTQAPGNSGKRTKMLLVGIVVAAALGVGGFFAGNMLSSKPPAAPAAPVTPAPIFVTMDAFTVNLKSEDNDRYLHTGLSLKVSDAATQSRLAEYMPEARSRVLLLLSAQQPADLATVEGKHKLAESIKAKLKEPFATTLQPQQIVDVLFTSFVVQ
jgi:flagellar FliL protein